MSTARKLPSGSWRCLAYSHTEEIPQPDGTFKKKRIYKSFTCDDPSAKGRRKCEAEAAAWAANKEQQRPTSDMTFGEALDEYIKLRSAVLSPTTIREYKRSRNKDLQGLVNMKLNQITQIDIQKEINKEALTHSPKTVKNMHGLLSAVFDVYRPDFRLKTDLPKKVRTELYIPSDGDIARLMEEVAGTEMEIPILLAAFGPMRRGEICALDSDHINGNIIHVEFALVLGEEKKWIKKSPKSYAGNRLIVFPDFVIEKLKDIRGNITNLTPDIISHRFTHILDRAGLPHFRFHDLRHYSASIQHAMGIPEAYIMQRGGWASDNVLKSIYRHAMDEEITKQNEKLNNYFSKLCNTKCNTNEKKC